MNYIIDPMWFYWVNVVDGLKSMLFAVTFILAVVALTLFMWFLFNKSDCNDYLAKIAFKKACTFMVITAVFGLLMVAVPSKQTLIEMQVARFATYENAEWTVETIKQAVDYIVEAVGSLK